MKSTFHHKLVNRPHEDPCLYVRLLRERRALLFDIGNIDRLGQAELSKVTDVFVTHTHIDHFIGFDTLLRALLRRERPLNIYGPENITACLEGKLQGYTWNHIHEYPIRIEAYALDKDVIRRSGFYAEERFRRIDRGTTCFDGILLREPTMHVSAAVMSHGIPCLGFSLKEETHINIRREVLTAMSLPVGPWLGDYKRMLREGAHPDTPLFIGGKRYSFSDLKDIAIISKGQKIAYIMDISPEQDNIKKAVELAGGSETLYCEAYYMHEDLERAFERAHLTAKTAGDIAREAGVERLVVMHFSPKYSDMSGMLEDEAMKAFGS